jgi:hypothetical protein
LSYFKVEKKEVCKGYAFNRHVNSIKHRSREILDLIHLDICGPMSLASLSCNIYYVSFIEETLKIYFMKTKDETFRKFQEFKAPIEIHIGKKIKAISFDNGGEYISNGV